VNASGIDAEVLWAAGYAALLLLSALGFAWMARRSHRHLFRSATSGFRFHDHLNAWECAAGEFLRLHHLDADRGIARYKADGKCCNRCGMKRACTDLDDGRELSLSLKEWTRTELGQFQRVLSFTLVSLAGIVLVIEMTRHHAPYETLIGGISLVAALSIGRRILRDAATGEKIRRTRVDMPEHPAEYWQPGPGASRRAASE
jgi:hypothetical protein